MKIINIGNPYPAHRTAAFLLQICGDTRLSLNISKKENFQNSGSSLTQVFQFRIYSVLWLAKDSGGLDKKVLILLLKYLDVKAIISRKTLVMKYEGRV